MTDLSKAVSRTKRLARQFQAVLDMAEWMEEVNSFEQRYKESESYNREQREIIDRLTSGGIESDKSIGRLESRLIRIKGNIDRIKTAIKRKN